MQLLVESEEKRTSFELYKLKRMLKILRSKKGFHTELTSLYCPPSRPVSDITNYLKSEYGQASNIKSKSTRKTVMDSITKLIKRLQMFGRSFPENGLAMFAGGIPQNGPGTEKFEMYIIEPPKPIQTFQYRCAAEFYLEPLEEMLIEKDVFGFIVIDRSGCVIATVSGNHKRIIEKVTSHIPSKHGAGGQSQRRFERLIEEAARNFYVKSGEHINNAFLGPDGKPIVKGIIVGGAGPTKEFFVKSEYLDYRLQKIVLKVLDTAYSSEQGVKDLISKSEDILKDVQLLKDKKIFQKFLSHLSRDTGMVTYGEKEIRRALEQGAVDTLLISEKLDIERVTVSCNNCDYQEEKTVHLDDLDAYRKEIAQKHCPKCNSDSLTISKIVDFIEELGDLAEASGATVMVISTESEEGAQLWAAFKGLAAILRYKFE